MHKYTTKYIKLILLINISLAKPRLLDILFNYNFLQIKRVMHLYIRYYL
jgi:hypothetical protein